MEILLPQLCERGKPCESPAVSIWRFCLEISWTSTSFAEKGFLHVVVKASVLSGLQFHDYITGFLLHLLERAFEGPPKAPGRVLVHRFQHHKDTPNLERGGTEQSAHTPAHHDFMGEFRVRPFKREPDKERVDNPDAGTDGERDGDQVGYVPVREDGRHPPDSFQNRAHGGCLLGQEISGLLCGMVLVSDLYGMSSLPVVSRTPQELDIFRIRIIQPLLRRRRFLRGYVIDSALLHLLESLRRKVLSRSEPRVGGIQERESPGDMGGLEL